MLKRVLFLLLLVLYAICHCTGVAVAQGKGTEPYQGLKSVADRAEKNWNEAHVNFRKLASDSQDPCDETVKQALANAQSGLQERTRAWKEFYRERGRGAEDARKAAADIQSQMDEEMRAVQNDLTQWADLLADLKHKRADLDGPGSAGLNPEDLTKAKANLDALIKIREESIADAQQTLASDKESIRLARQTQEDEHSDASAIQSYGQLIDTQDTMYKSIYRAREIRLTLQCRPPAVPPPPPPPKP